MSTTAIIVLCAVGAVFLFVIGWLIWSVEKANRANPKAKTGTFAAGTSVGSEGGDTNSAATGGDTGGGGFGGGGDGGGGGGG